MTDDDNPEHPIVSAVLAALAPAIQFAINAVTEAARLDRAIELTAPAFKTIENPVTSFAEVHVPFNPALRLVDRTMDYMIVPEGGVRTFPFSGSPEAYDLAVEFTRRVNAESDGKLKATFEPLHKRVEVYAPEAEPESSSELFVDPPTEREPEEVIGVVALWSALRNNGRRGQIVINHSTIESARMLVDCGLAEWRPIQAMTERWLVRSALANELFVLESPCTFDSSRCICTNSNDKWHCNPKCQHCHPEIESGPD